MQDFLYLKLGVPLNLDMELVGYDKSIQARLKECRITNLDVNMKESWLLNFDCPYYITDEMNRTQIVNQNYNLIKEEKLIRLKCNNSYAIFVIKEISENATDNYKSVQCYSIDKMITKEVVINNETIQLNADELETGEGIFDRMADSVRGWKLGHIDDLARIEHDVDIRANKYRFFESIQKKWYEFLREDVQSSFDVILFFDTYNKLVNCYDRLSYGNDTGWYISKKNISKNMNKTTSTKDLVTKLYVTGKDDLTISSVNALGAYVQNYDYFKTDMSQSLQNALIVYESVMSNLFVQWNSKQVEYMDIQSQHDTLVYQQTILDTQIKAKKAEQAIVIKEGNATDITRVKGELDVLTVQLTALVAQINSAKLLLDAKQAELDTITGKMQLEDIVDSNGNPIFTDDNLDELDAYTNEKSVQNDVYFTAQALYSWAKEEIKNLSKPLVEFSVESQNFIDDVKGYEGYNGQIGIGDWFFIKDDKLGKEKVRLVGYKYNPKDKSLSLEFTNNDKPEKDNRSYGSAIKKIAGTERYLNAKKFEWNEASMQKDFVKTLRQSGLDVAMSEIFSVSNKNKINIDKSGIWIRNAEDENKVIVITASAIVVSNDGLSTATTAIDADGIYADLLVGRILAGEKLYISNANNDFRIDENGITADVNKLSIRSANSLNTLQGLFDLSAEGLRTEFKQADTVLKQDYSSQITQTAQQISNKVSYTDYNGTTIASLINQTYKSISQSALNINLDGFVTFTSLNTPGATTIDGANLKTGTVVADRVSATNAVISGGRISFQINGTEYAQVNGEGDMIVMSLSARREAWDSSGSVSGGIDCYNLSSSGYANLNTINGSTLSISGSKACVQGTQNYGDTYMWCDESTHVALSDDGEGIIDGDGLCYVYLDPQYLEMVSTNLCDYRVHLTGWVGSNVEIYDKQPDYFVVSGTAGKRFDWKVSCERKGYERLRMNEVSEVL